MCFIYTKKGTVYITHARNKDLIHIAINETLNANLKNNLLTLSEATRKYLNGNI